MIKLKIKGMTCAHCVRAVTKALENVPGVEKVIEVSVDRGEALVDGTSDHVAPIAAVEEQGYHAEVVL